MKINRRAFMKRLAAVGGGATIGSVAALANVPAVIEIMPEPLGDTPTHKGFKGDWYLTASAIYLHDGTKWEKQE